MKMMQLLERWDSLSSPREARRKLEIALTLHDVARLRALNEMYPGRQMEDMLADLVHASLDELQEAFPYVHGERQVGEDEFGNPIYEDIGPTPRFLTLMQKHLNGLDHH